MGRAYSDLTGKRLEHAYVLHFAGHRGSKKVRHWLCRCDCGTEYEIRSTRLKSHCGCLASRVSSEAHKKHGMTGTPEFKSWEGARRRCENPNDKDYPRYGGRGIRFSHSWRRFEDFYCAMGPRPGPGYSLDRIDTNGNYEPGNCRWATAVQQQNNRRNNVKMIFEGREITVFEYFGKDHMSKDRRRAAWRIRNGWSVADAIFQPLHARMPKMNMANARPTW